MFLYLKLEIKVDDEEEISNFIEKFSIKYNLKDRGQYREFTDDVLDGIVLEACVRDQILSAEVFVSK